jgi:asparagine N-glycosylation enzyme membrane subunit Stt3
MPLTGFAIWLGLLAAAGLSFPRRPRLAGLLFIVLGVWSIVLRFASVGSARPVSIGIALGAGVVWFAVGIRQLLKFRDPDARAAHVKHWTA